MKRLMILLVTILLVSCGDKANFEVDGQAKGERGADGKPCTVEGLSNGVIIRCPDGTSQALYHGEDGTSSKTITEFIDPCGDDPGHFDEILLKMFDDSIVGYYQDGDKRFLVNVPAGDYVTTDAQACAFTVNEDLTVEWD